MIYENFRGRPGMGSNGSATPGQAQSGSVFGRLRARMDAAKMGGQRPMAPERSPGIMSRFGDGAPPPTRAAMPAMLTARRNAAQQAQQPIADQGAFGPGLDGGHTSLKPKKMNGLQRWRGGGGE